LYDCYIVTMDGKAGSMDELAKRLAPHSKLFVKQTFTWGDGCCALLCDLRNKYIITSGSYDGPQVLIGEEKSECFNRVCCGPNHSFLIHLTYPENPGTAAYTIQRDGCDGCTKPCLCCFACSDSCLDEMTLHEGHKNRVDGILENPAPVFRAQQAPASQSMFEPVVNVFAHGATETSMQVTGPTCFGGCSEFCCPASFVATDPKGSPKGALIKPKPDGCCEVLKACCTPFDRYEMDYDANTSGEEKAAMLTSTFLTDQMYFEGDPGMCGRDDHGCYINLCYMYCAGCLIPCKLRLPKGGGGGG